LEKAKVRHQGIVGGRRMLPKMSISLSEDMQKPSPAGSAERKHLVINETPAIVEE
jgi:hypothetical protein